MSLNIESILECDYCKKEEKLKIECSLMESEKTGFILVTSKYDVLPNDWCNMRDDRIICRECYNVYWLNK